MAKPPSQPTSPAGASAAERWYADVDRFLHDHPESVFPHLAQRDELLMACGAFSEAQVAYRHTGNGNSLPTVKMRLESGKTIVSAIVTLPSQYPDRDVPSVSFKSISVPSVVLRSLERTIEDELQDMLSTSGSVPLLIVLGRCMECVRDLPVSSQSNHFGVCMNCNKRLVQHRQPKTCQPLRCTLDEDGQVLEASCIVCQSDQCIYCPLLKPNVEACCDMCLVEDNPLIDLECGCKSCVGCFQAFADVETGEKRVFFSKRHGMYGIQCPNHKGAAIVDPALVKLMHPRAFGRYNFFALQDFATIFQLFVCPLPNCAGYPTASQRFGGLMQCGFCKRFSCVRCSLAALDCRCTELAPDETRNHLVARAFQRLPRSRPAYGKLVAKGETIRVQVFFGLNKFVAMLHVNNPNWHSTSWEITEGIFPLKIEAAQFIWSGLPLIKGQPVADTGLYNGAVVFVVVELDQNNRDRSEEMELWRFRRQIDGSGGSAKLSDTLPAKDGLYKKCPRCSKPVIHYFGHGCHHIGAHGSCCGFHWCYLCGNEYPGCKCPIFCPPDCKCPPCPECRPFRPCVLCPGCPACNVTEEAAPAAA